MKRRHGKLGLLNALRWLMTGLVAFGALSTLSGCEMFLQQSDSGWTRADGRTPGAYQGITETGASSTPNARNWGGHPSVPIDRRAN